MAFLILPASGTASGVDVCEPLAVDIPLEDAPVAAMAYGVPFVNPVMSQEAARPSVVAAAEHCSVVLPITVAVNDAKFAFAGSFANVTRTR
jgi:hypothetical protein